MVRFHQSSFIGKLLIQAVTFFSLLIAATTYVCAEETYSVGADAGSFFVGNNGGGSWTLPIEVPPGIKGMVPNMTVSLSTSSANGLLGQGGGLSGSSAISRCSESIAQDGVAGRVRVVQGDQYCLDGNRLILVSGVHGAANSEYRTELESFQKVIANSSAGGAGPESFTVVSRSGSSMTYGGTSESRITHSSGAILSWRISRLEDISSNYMEYVYSASSAESLLQSIHYGGNVTAGQAPFLAVTINYENRPDTSSGYHLGSLQTSTKRISTIQTWSDTDLVRDYQFSYELNPVTNQSRLKQAKECAGSGSCLAPTTFNYASMPTQWSSTSIAIPHDLQGSDGQPLGLQADINNDGWLDWLVSVRYANGTTTKQTWLGSATGFTSNVNWSLPTVLYDYQLYVDGLGTAQLIDINGDGYADVVEAYQTSNGIIKNAWLSTGQGFTSTSQFTVPDVFVSTVNLNRGETRLRFVELNGDGLVDALIDTRDSTNNRIRNAWINNGTGWTESSQWLSKELLSDYNDSSYPGELDHSTLADVNGDGLADWVQAVRYSVSSSQKRVWLNNGAGWEGQSTAFVPPVEILDYSAHKRGHPKGSFVDLNADGLVDMVHAIIKLDGTSVTEAWLNTGEGWIAQSSWALPASMYQYKADGYTDALGSLVDLTGDGQPEYVQSWRNISGGDYFNAWTRDNGAWVSLSGYDLPIPLFKQHSGQSSTPLAQINDLNGDGIAEMYTATTGQSTVSFQKGTLQNNLLPGAIAQITNGLGIETYIEYGVATDNSIYTPADKTPYPNIADNNNRLLIKNVRISNGLGGWNEASHHYTSSKFNVIGRGGLGFASHSATDGRSGIKVTTSYYQDFPFTGMTQSSSNKTATGITLASGLSQVEQRLLNGGKTIYPYASSSESDDFDLHTGAWIQKKAISTTMDDYGNATHSTEIITNYHGESFTKNHTITPLIDTTNWILNKTGLSTQTVSQPGKASHTTTVNNTEYYPGTNLLKTEVLEPSDPHSLTSAYEYDDFGNRIKTTISTTSTPTPALQPRVTQTSFTNQTGRADGRFPVLVTNTLQHSATTEFSSAFGKPLTTTDANGVTKKYYYDDFGTQLNETIVQANTLEPDGKEVAIPHWCLTEHNCPPNAKYFVAALDNQREAPEAAYYDVYGREIRRLTQGMGGAPIYQDTEYDVFGRKHRISSNYFKDNVANGTEQIRWKTIQHDILDRPESVTMPDNGITQFAYDRLTTTTTNALLQDHVVTKNILGKPKTSTDNGGTTQFAYDVRGNLLETTDEDSNQIVNTYDHFGRKKTMLDPDMGFWEYDYDAFGQLTSQTDANLEVVTMAYDNLGRMTQRDEREGITTWNYDTAAHGVGKLQSVTGPLSIQLMEYDELGRPDKSTLTTGGQAYVTETGYQGVTGKVDWVKYPTGLVVRKRFDDYGFPIELESVDLQKYQAYRAELDKANNHYRNAQILQEQHNDEYEALKAIVQPFYDRMNSAQQSAGPILNLVDRTYSKEAQHAGLANQYITEYNIHATPYNQHIEDANDYITEANTQNGLGNTKANQANAKYALASTASQSAYEHLSAYYGYINQAQAYANSCNAGQTQYCALADQSEATALSKYAVYESQTTLANTYTSQGDTLSSQANAYYANGTTASNNATTQNNLAQQYEERVTIYGSLFESHQNIQLGFQARRESYENQAVPFIGRWKKRTDDGTVCLTWAGDDTGSESCVTEKGAFQNEWDALAATGKEDRYKEIIALIEDEIELGDDAKALADTHYDDYKDNAIVYWTALEADADGQTKKAKYGNGVESVWGYDQMGRVGSIHTVSPYTGGAQTSNLVQNDIYDFDLIGNLEYRHDYIQDFKEDFEYDTLNRLTKAEVSGAGASAYALAGLDTITLTYDLLGNIKTKSDVTGASGEYVYGQSAGNAGPHAVSSISGNKNTNFTYDDNGNQLSGNDRIIDYTSFNKPERVQKVTDGVDIQMTYGPSRSLLMQVELVNGESTTTKYLGGLYEEIVKAGTTKVKHHLTIGGQAVAVLSFDKTTSGSYTFDDTHYLHRDHLNSITAITDHQGKIVDRFHFDAFGKRRTAVQAPFYAAGLFPISSMGFTGHKQLTSTDLIHMGGRVYDPEVGRFLSADPHIQSPLNTQSLNRYSYVKNNPLSYTDPSGYFFKKLFKSIKKIFKKIVKVIKKVVKAIVKVVKAVVKVVKKAIKVIKKYIKPILAVAVAIIAPMALPAMLGTSATLAGVALTTSAGALTAAGTIFAGAVGGGLAGLVATGSLKGMLIGAVSGAAFAGIGNHFAGVKAANAVNGVKNVLSNGLTAAQQIGKIVLHGVAGGARAVLSGGKFKDGFVAAGFAQLAAPVIDNIDSSAGQVVAAGVAGGVGSELVGGDFESGFVTGVFSRGFNDVLHIEGAIKVPAWLGKLIYGSDYIGQGGAAGIAISYPGLNGGKFDAGVYVEGHAGGGDIGTGRATIGLGYAAGDVQSMSGSGNVASFNDGIGGLAVSTDTQNNLSGVSLHVGPGYNVGTAGTITSSYTIRDGFDWLREKWNN